MPIPVLNTLEFSDGVLSTTTSRSILARNTNGTIGLFDATSLLVPSIHNQTDIYQLASFKISGTGVFGSSSNYAQLGPSLLLSNQNFAIRSPRLYLSDNEITPDLSGLSWRVIIDSGTSSGNGVYVKGKILATDNSSAFSDRRLKSNIKRMSDGESIALLNARSYRYNGSDRVGFVAQEVRKHFPGLVNKEDNGYLSLNYIGLIPYMVEFMKSSRKMIDGLRKEIDELKKKQYAT